MSDGSHGGFVPVAYMKTSVGSAADKAASAASIRSLPVSGAIVVDTALVVGGALVVDTALVVEVVGCGRGRGAGVGSCPAELVDVDAGADVVVGAGLWVVAEPQPTHKPVLHGHHVCPVEHGLQAAVVTP